MQKSILIVEDERDVRSAIVEGLKDSNFLVATASDGTSGYTKAVELRPDLVVLDLVMPKASGHTMLEQLRNHSWGRTVPVIILTAYDNDSNLGAVYDRGVTNFIVKSTTSLKETVDKIKQVVEGAAQ